jgi:hypothetical protein
MSTTLSRSAARTAIAALTAVQRRSVFRTRTARGTCLRSTIHDGGVARLLVAKALDSARPRAAVELQSFATLFTGTEQGAGVKLGAKERSGIAALFSGASDLAGEPGRAFERRSLALLLLTTSDSADAIGAPVIADGRAWAADTGRGKATDNSVGVRARIGSADVDTRIGNVTHPDVGYREIDFDVGLEIDVRIG